MIPHSPFNADHARFSAGQFDLRAGEAGGDTGEFVGIDVRASLHPGHVFF